MFCILAILASCFNFSAGIKSLSCNNERKYCVAGLVCVDGECMPPLMDPRTPEVLFTVHKAVKQLGKKQPKNANVVKID
uniref:Nodule Cysteine-Rich (NCR) secreted peptide n=1 Tax=Panagrellus redivivus TaxID=6233 RepID=A0A7E4VI13_PANRE